MIVIAFAFAVITYFEWSYLSHYRRSLRARVLVLSTIGFLFLLSELVNLMHERFSMGKVINVIFGTVQRWLFAGE